MVSLALDRSNDARPEIAGQLVKRFDACVIGIAADELVEYIHLHGPKLTKVIAGVETVDYPSDAQLVAYARKYLMATDRMQP
jgi:hypothetical protein